MSATFDDLELETLEVGQEYRGRLGIGTGLGPAGKRGLGWDPDPETGKRPRFRVVGVIAPADGRPGYYRVKGIDGAPLGDTSVAFGCERNFRPA